MRLLVAGASGRTGRILTGLALDRGHDVTALVRDPSRLGIAHANLHVIQADVLAPETLTTAFSEVDVVVSLLAPRPRRNGRVYVEGTRNLADAAAAAAVRRLVVVSASGAGVQPEVLPLAYRLVLRIPVVARLYPDLATMERDIAARTDIDWTIVRAAILTSGPRTGAYRTALGETVPGGLRISRADLAEFLLGLVESDRYIRQRVALAH